MSKLKIWTESVKEHCGDSKYKIPKKGTKEYDAVRKIYERRLNGGCVKNCKNNKCEKYCQKK